MIIATLPLGTVGNHLTAAILHLILILVCVMLMLVHVLAFEAFVVLLLKVSLNSKKIILTG
jgi:hypothetical protein